MVTKWLDGMDYYGKDKTAFKINIGENAQHINGFTSNRKDDRFMRHPVISVVFAFRRATLCTPVALCA